MEKIKPLNREDWVDADPVNGVAGAIPPAKAFSQTMAEMVNVIESAGLTPSGDDLTQFDQAIKGLVKKEVDEANLLAVSNTVYQRGVGDFYFTHNKNRGTKTTGSQNGGYECNGDEFAESDFEGEATPYKLLCDNLLPWVSYSNYKQILGRFGNCGFFALDKENKTFKVPTITDAFLQAGTPGVFKEAGIPNILGKFESGANSSWADTRTGWEGAFKLGKARGGSGERRGMSQYQGEFDASLSNPIYGNSDTVQPNAVTCRVMVQLANEIDNATSIEKYLNELKEAKNDALNSINTSLNKLEQTEAEALKAIADDKEAAVDEINTAKNDATDKFMAVADEYLQDIEKDRADFEQFIDETIEPFYDKFEEKVEQAQEQIPALDEQNEQALENIETLRGLNEFAMTTAEKAENAATAATEAEENAVNAKEEIKTMVQDAIKRVDDKILDIDEGVGNGVTFKEILSDEQLRLVIVCDETMTFNVVE